MSEQSNFREAIARYEDAMLITRAPDGALRARPMAMAVGDGDGDLWFATGLDTTKIDEILMDERVLVTMQRPGEWLSISGVAALVRDKEKIRSLWTEAWRTWFPQGEGDPDLTLIHVRAREAEVWDMRARRSTFYVFEGSRAVVRDRRPVTAHVPQPRA